MNQTTNATVTPSVTPTVIPVTADLKQPAEIKDEKLTAAPAPVAQTDTKPEKTPDVKAKPEKTKTEPKGADLGLGMDIKAHIADRTEHVDVLSVKISKEESVKFKFGWIPSVLGKKDVVTMPIKTFRARLLKESGIVQIDFNDVTLAANKDIFKEYGIVQDKKAKLDWAKYYDAVLKFKYTILVKGVRVLKFKSSETVILVKQEFIDKMGDKDHLYFKLDMPAGKKETVAATSETK